METKSRGIPNLTELPTELLECILVQIETAQALLRLSLTCKSLRAIVEKHGFRIFVQSRFPSISVPLPPIPRANNRIAAVYNAPNFWKDAVHGLTTLSRNWDRRAIIAQTIQDPESKYNNHAVEAARLRRRRGPSMGYRPVIDSYEAWYGGDWASRKEVVAWGAGARLVMRSRIMGLKALEDGIGERSDQNLKPRWHTYSKKGALEGRDDITALNLIPQQLGDAQELLLGRASGSLELIRMNEESGHEIFATYDTREAPVRSTTMHHFNRVVAAACLGDRTVALYPTSLEGRKIQSYASTSVQKAGESARTWSSEFLNEGRLAVGLGRSNQPIHIYDLGEGFPKLEQAIHLSLDGDAILNRLDVTGPLPFGTSIYSIAPLPRSSTSSGAEGDTFLSGAYDAHVRLHDLRLSSTVVSLFSDPVDAYSAIYSLMPIGRERFIAGGAQHSLIKVFDLRMPGQKLYHAADVSPCSQQLRFSSERRESSKSEIATAKNCGIGKRCAFHTSIHTPRNWNVFLGTRNHGQDQSLESPVYSLTRPSTVSPTFYAGVRNCIMQLDIVSVLDQHPDSVYGARLSSPKPSSTGRSSLASTSFALRMAQEIEMDAATITWDPEQEVMSLPMYEQADQVVLMHQQPVRTTCSRLVTEGKFQGLDERWGGVSVKEGGQRGNITRRERW